ncbi:MAG TPA: PASTA domain-containing protein [Solirubrobacterales bacterium]|nr:PASTA domain-containing protein [Solirubrobacterales bacterium]
MPLTAVTTDPGTDLIYAQENEGTSFFVYDPRTNAWSELAPAPLNSGNNGGAAYLGGKIYITYTGNRDEMSVYDVASNSWTTIENPLEEGTADITAGNGRLYIAVNQEFFEYDPGTGNWAPLAEPPEFAPEGCNDGFEPWGALEFDGSKIYGHQGDGCNGFAVYDFATDKWTELALTPAPESEGPVAGAAIDPVTNTYLTYGTYGGETLFRYDLEAGTWSTDTLPFEVEDGGMAYVDLPGHEGVYMIQGEEGNEFTRYTEQNEADLSAAISAGVAASATGGEITYSIQVKNNGPERAGGVVLSDALPGGTKLVSAGASQGSCAGTSTVSCGLGALAGGASANVTIKVTAGFGTLTNAASVTSQAVDGNGANDSAAVTVTIPATNPAPAPTCVVPKVRGFSLKRAKKALRRAGCKPGKVTHRYSHKVKKRRVIRGSKRPRTVLPEGTKVNLTVSRGAKHKNHHKRKAHR